jgi:beta-glucosidase
MKKINIIAILMFMSSIAAAQQSLKLTSKNIGEVVKKMTLEEKAKLVVGHLPYQGKIGQKPDFDYPGTGMPIGGVPRFGAPVTICSDGSYGVKRYTKMSNGLYGTTAFPIPIGTACSWNTEVSYNFGKAYGEEGLEYGIDVLLGPAMNIHRNPLCGRNFEYFSEDPLLAGWMAAGEINGIQSNGVGTSVKHFATNNQETQRVVNDARLSTRALREIYLRGFEIAVKNAHPWTIMTAYSTLNGKQCGENRELMMDIARGEWGFDGIFMTDFGGLGWAPTQIAAGNDLVMPGSVYNVQNVINAVNTGSLKMADLDYCCKNMLRYILKTRHYAGYKYSKRPDLDAHKIVSRKYTPETFVMLKNEGLLPTAGTPAFFGICSYKTWISGRGSGKVTSDYQVNLADAFENNNPQIKHFYTSYIDSVIENTPRKHVFGGQEYEIPDMTVNDCLVKNAAKESDYAIVTFGRNAGEGSDRKPIKGDWMLTDEETELLKTVSDDFHAVGKKVLVLLNVNGIVETESWNRMADGIMLVWLPGSEGGNALLDVITGQVSPSGKLCSTFPVKYEDCPSFANFPNGSEQTSIAEEDNGYQLENEEKKKQKKIPGATILENGKTRFVKKQVEKWVKNVDYTNYDEDIYVGYRYYDTFNKAVSYPFGYGLSYTSFKYGKPIIKKNGNGYDISVSVTNTGNHTGKEVVEVYSAAPANMAGQECHRLVAFGKTQELKPGEIQTLTMYFTEKDLSWYNDHNASWMLNGGKYIITCASSSRAKGESATIIVPKTKVIEKTTTSCRPRLNLHLLKP